MTESWDRLADAVRARRKALQLTQQEVANLAGVNVMTIRNLEGLRKFSRMPGTIASVEKALGWAPRSAAAILEGGEPTLLSESAHTSAADEGAATADGRDLPASIRWALQEGETLAGDVIELTRPGSKLRLIVVVKRGSYSTEEDRERLRGEMEEWLRVQQGIRDVVRGDGAPGAAQ